MVTGRVCISGMQRAREGDAWQEGGVTHREAKPHPQAEDQEWALEHETHQGSRRDRSQPCAQLCDVGSQQGAGAERQPGFSAALRLGALTSRERGEEHVQTSRGDFLVWHVFSNCLHFMCKQCHLHKKACITKA